MSFQGRSLQKEGDEEDLTPSHVQVLKVPWLPPVPLPLVCDRCSGSMRTPHMPPTCRPVLRVFSLPALFCLQLFLHTFKAQLKCHLLSEALLDSLR